MAVGSRENVGRTVTTAAKAGRDWRLVAEQGVDADPQPCTTRQAALLRTLVSHLTCVERVLFAVERLLDLCLAVSIMKQNS